MRALSSRPFCSYAGRQAGLLYLPAGWRYTTHCVRIGVQLAQMPHLHTTHVAVGLLRSTKLPACPYLSRRPVPGSRLRLLGGLPTTPLNVPAKLGRIPRNTPEPT